MKTMKATIMALALLTGATAFAQPGMKRGAVEVKSTEERREMMRERLESRKIGYITDALDLTPEEAQAFWPVYNQHQAEKEKLREEQMENAKMMNSEEPMSAEDLDTFMRAKFSRERRQTDLDEKYYAAYKNVLTPEKTAQLYKAEREFKREMMRTMRRESAREGSQNKERSRMRERGAR